MPIASTRAAPVSAEPRDERGAVGDRAEHAALHRHHLDRRVMVALVGGAAAIRQQQALETAVVGFAHGGVHAHVGGDAAQHDVVDAPGPKDQFQVGRAEAAFSGFVDHHFAQGAGACRTGVGQRGQHVALGPRAERDPGHPESGEFLLARRAEHPDDADLALADALDQRADGGRVEPGPARRHSSPPRPGTPGRARWQQYGDVVFARYLFVRRPALPRPQP